jgi:hypothetical protein
MRHRELQILYAACQRLHEDLSNKSIKLYSPGGSRHKWPKTENHQMLKLGCWSLDGTSNKGAPENGVLVFMLHLQIVVSSSASYCPSAGNVAAGSVKRRALDVCLS